MAAARRSHRADSSATSRMSCYEGRRGDDKHTFDRADPRVRSLQLNNLPRFAIELPIRWIDDADRNRNQRKSSGIPRLVGRAGVMTERSTTRPDRPSKSPELVLISPRRALTDRHLTGALATQAFSESFACVLLSILALLAAANASLRSFPFLVFASFTAAL